jgi:hypothetical protein
VINWREPQNEQLYNKSPSSNIVRVIKTKMRFTGYKACIEVTRNEYETILRKLQKDSRKPRHK